MSYLRDHAATVAALTLQHLGIVGMSLAAALLLAVPLCIVAVRMQAVSTLVLGLLGALYTVPSLALLAVLVSIFGLGTAPVFVALVLYAQFMLVRSFVTALRGVDPGAVDAARGLGFTAAGRLLRVEVPLALPVAIGGIRVAAVAMIAIATLGGYVGAGGLGTLIFNGLTLRHDDMIVAGAICVCVIAVVVDGALRMVERSARSAIS